MPPLEERHTLGEESGHEMADLDRLAISIEERS